MNDRNAFLEDVDALVTRAMDSVMTDLALTIPKGILSEMIETSPDVAGRLVYLIAVDTATVSTLGVVPSLRDDMSITDEPAILEDVLKHVPDELSPDMPDVATYRPSKGEFTITFSRFPDESEIEAYVVIGGKVLHTRDVRSRPFDRHGRMA
jgi:hypothetical protein